MNTVTVNTPSHCYDVLIGTGLLQHTGEQIKKVHAPCKAAVISDDKVAALYGETVLASLKDAGFTPVLYTFLNGEERKNADTYFSILNFLAEEELTRSDLIVALGGGVTGDLSGFAAATYLRGIPFVQCPTTLLAAVDSSVGGKTAIDLPAGKNLAGAFYQPDLVLCDTDTLKTLEPLQIANGFGEIIKYGMICDKELFDLLAADTPPSMEEIIARCVSIKRDVVVEDEKDTGVRQLLNFGHTFGHAVEKCSDFTLQHGCAVAVGMVLMTSAATAEGLSRKEDLLRLKELLKKYDLPLSADYSAEELFKVVLADKKRRSDHITLVLPNGIGNCILKKMPLTKAKELLTTALLEE